jgi:hypothetical protein
MPNWCNNSVIITHPDRAELQRLVDAYNSGQTMQTMHPCPQELRDTVAGALADETAQKALEQRQQENIEKYGSPHWYDWCCDNWGVKWDFGRESPDCPAAEIQTADDGSLYVTLGFDTAWAPPLGFYEHLHTLGFHVKAYYFEMGMGFVGSSTNGNENTINIREFTQEWLSDNVPAKLCDTFNLYEYAAENEEAERAYSAQKNNPADDNGNRAEAI